MSALILVFIMTILVMASGLLEGWREAMFYHLMANERVLQKRETLSWRFDEHNLFFLFRVIMFVITGVALLYLIQEAHAYALLMISFMGLFWFWHDSSYYFFRHQYNPESYPKGPFSNNRHDPGDVQTISITFRCRIAVLIISVILWCVGIYLTAIEI